jgi:hypothetical protein
MTLFVDSFAGATAELLSTNNKMIEKAAHGIAIRNKYLAMFRSLVDECRQHKQLNGRQDVDVRCRATVEFDDITG